MIPYSNRDYLKHHGILGQKWGDKNGPPYPLDSSDHSAREKKAGWRKSIHTGSPNVSNQERHKLTTKQKKLIVAGATVVAAGLAAYGIYKYKNINKSNPLTPDQLRAMGITPFEFEKFEPERINIDKIEIPQVEIPKVKTTAEKIRDVSEQFSKDTKGYTKTQINTLSEAKKRLEKAISSGDSKNISNEEWFYNYIKNLIDTQNENFKNVMVTPEMIKDAERLGVDVRDLVVKPLAVKG